MSSFGPLKYTPVLSTPLDNSSGAHHSRCEREPTVPVSEGRSWMNTLGCTPREYNSIGVLAWPAVMCVYLYYVHHN
jgi:hypothetical protein